MTSHGLVWFEAGVRELDEYKPSTWFYMAIFFVSFYVLAHLLFFVYFNPVG